MGETRRIAGHDFDLSGHCIREGCQLSSRRLAEIMSATTANVDHLGWAHYGVLSAAEQAEIEAERARVWAAHGVA